MRKKAKLGITELLKHDMLEYYPVLKEKDGEYVAQFKFTAILTRSETMKLTSQPLPFVKSDYEIADTKIKNILAMGLKRTKKKGKKKKKGAAGGAGGEVHKEGEEEGGEGKAKMDTENVD